MMESDNINLDDDRNGGNLAHPVRDEQDIEKMLEGMNRVEDREFQEELLNLRNNIDNFIRTRVNNHNTHIGLTVDPQVNNVEIDGDSYEVVGERFFGLNQFETSLGDTGMVQWTALAPEDSWGVENPFNRGEHAVARNRNIEAYRVTLNGEELDSGEISKLSKDIRIAERTENDLSPSAPEWLALYDSVGEVIEEEENISREEVDEELRKSQHRGLITEDYDITLKGLLSFLDADARGFGSLEDGQHDEINVGDIQPENLPPFGSLEGSKLANGETVLTISSEGERVSVNRFDSQIDFETGEISHEDRVGQLLVEKLGSDRVEDIRDGLNNTMTLAELADMFIPDYSGGEIIEGNMIEDGLAENWAYRLIEQDLARIEDSNILNFGLGQRELRRDQETMDEILAIAGFESVSELEKDLAEALNGIEANENNMGAVGQNSFVNQMGLGRYSFDYDQSSASPVVEYIFDSTDLDRSILNDVNLPDEEEDFGLFTVTPAELALAPYKNNLAESGVEMNAEGYNSSITLTEEVESEVREVIDYLDENGLVEINELERFSELQISLDPDEADYDSLRQLIEDNSVITYEQVQRNAERSLLDKAVSGIPFIGSGKDEIEISVDPDESVLVEASQGTNNRGLSEIYAEMLMEDLEAIDGVYFEQENDMFEEVIFEDEPFLSYEIDVGLEQVSLDSDQQVSVEAEFDQQELIYNSVDSIRKASKAINPFNGEDILYEEVVFETGFEYDHKSS